MIKARNELNAALYNADATQADMEADGERAAMNDEEQKAKTRQIEAEAERVRRADEGGGADLRVDAGRGVQRAPRAGGRAQPRSDGQRGGLQQGRRR